MKRLIQFALVTLVGAVLPLQAQWWAAFSQTGPEGASERTNLCDKFVPEAFQLIYGPPPLGNACESNHDKVRYFADVERFVPGSDSVVGGPSADEFIKYGFGQPMVYTMKYGSYERRVVAFPGKEWDGPVPHGYLAASAEHYPYPIMSAASTRAIAGGACLVKLVKQVPPAYAKKNAENCAAKAKE